MPVKEHETWGQNMDPRCDTWLKSKFSPFHALWPRARSCDFLSLRLPLTISWVTRETDDLRVPC